MSDPTPCECESSDCNLFLGFVARYDTGTNRGYIRHLHCECRSHLYPEYDSIDRLREVERGVITEPPSANDLPTVIDQPITLPGTDQSREYDLDGVGNWDSTTYLPANDTTPTTDTRTHNDLNQITSGGLSYDNNGNLISDGTFSFAYDAFNRLRQVRKAGTLIAEYFYDAMGRRVRKVVGEMDTETGERDAITPSGISPEVRLDYDSLSRVVEETQGVPSPQYVTTTRFESEVIAEEVMPNDRVIETVNDILYRRQQVIDQADKAADPDTPPIAEWWYYGPGRTLATRLSNELLCSYGNNSLENSAVQQGGESLPEWGDACTDRLGYDGAGRMIGKRYLKPDAEVFAIEILGSTELTPAFPNRWEYTWKKVVFNGNGGFIDDPDGINYMSEGYGLAYNSIEANNPSAGEQGSGDRVGFPPTDIRLRPLGVGAVILNAQLKTSCAGDDEVYFTAPNNVDGPCDETPPT